MTPTRIVLAVTCILTVPVLASAQTSAAAPAAKMDCCAVGAGHGPSHATTAVLPLTLPNDERATALAAAVLLPPVEHAAHAAAEMACCNQHGHAAMAASPADRCAKGHDAHAGMKGGCGMPCCETHAPATPPER